MNPQDKFRRKVRAWLANNDISVNELATLVGKPRNSVSQAIHHERFPKVRAKIQAVIGK